MTLAETAYYELKNKILRGDLASGCAVYEEYFSSELSISRTPLRKALTRLAAEGYLVRGSDRTMRVPRPSKKELADTLQARILLECEAARMAAAAASPQQAARLDGFVCSERRAFLEHDTLTVSSLDRMFHNFIAEMTGNSVYETFISQIEFKTSLYLALSHTLGNAIRDALAEHAAIADAVRSNDPTAASQAMLHHLENVRKRLFEAI